MQCKEPPEPVSVVDATAPQEALVVENEVDTLAGEQTWPTEEEMADAEREAAANRKAKSTKVPKGTSQYQASWLDVSDSDDDGEDGARTIGRFRTTLG
jgi:pre-rRNA-processing protein TSR1